MTLSCLLSSSELDSLADRLIAKDSSLRVFGYASVVWDQGFPVNSRSVGRVDGFKRRFYQGNVSHRGCPNRPGRVATLVPSEGATVWGTAFEVVGAEAIRAALDHLTEREVRLGGYGCVRLTFRPLHSAEDAKLEAFAFIALAGNPQYLGKDSLERQARQVAFAVGPKGANADYVRGVANFMLTEVPNGEARDPHVFRLLRCIEAHLLQAEMAPAPASPSASLLTPSSSESSLSEQEQHPEDLPKAGGAAAASSGFQTADLIALNDQDSRKFS